MTGSRTRSWPAHRRAALLQLLAGCGLCASVQAQPQNQVTGWGARVFRPDDAIVYLSGSMRQPTEADTFVYDLAFKIQQYFRESTARGPLRYRVGASADANVSSVADASKNYLKGAVILGARYTIVAGSAERPRDWQLLLNLAPTIEQDKDNRIRNYYLSPEVVVTEFPGRLQTTVPIVVDTAADVVVDRGRVGWTVTPRIGLALGSNARQDTTLPPGRREEEVRRYYVGVDGVLDMSPIVQNLLYQAGRRLGRDWIGGGLLLRGQGTWLNAGTMEGREGFGNFTLSAFLLFTPTLGIEFAREGGRTAPRFAQVNTFRVAVAILAQ